MSYAREGIRGTALAEVLQREIDLRPKHRQIGGGQVNARTYAATLGDEIAASGLMGLDTAKRALFRIFAGETEIVTFDVADKILCALDLNHLWHTDLVDHVVEAVCPGCQQPNNLITAGCLRCRDRNYQRLSRARKSGSASRSGLGGLSTSRIPSSPRGGTDGATPLTEKEAA